MKPPSQRARRAAAWTGGVLAVAVGAVAVCELAGWPFLRQPLQQRMATAAGVPVLLDGRFHARLIVSPRLEVDHLRVGAGGGLPLPHLVDARGVALHWRWGDLWRWRQGDAPLRLRALSAAQLDAHLVRIPDGRASWQLGAPDRARPADPDRDPLDALPRFGRLQVQDGRIRVDDAPSRTQLQIALSGGEGGVAGGAGGAAGNGFADDRATGPAKAPAAASAAPARPAPAVDSAAPAGYRATAQGRWRDLPLDLRVVAGGALPLLQDDEQDAQAPAVPLRVEGRAGAAQVLFDGRAGALMGARRLQGELRFSGPSLARVGQPLGLTLPQTPPFELAGQLGHDAGVWRLQARSASIGKSRLNGDFTVDTRRRPAQLTGRLGGSRLALADLGPSVGAPATPAAKAARAQAAAAGRRVLPQRAFDLPSLKGMDADVQVAVAELDFGSAAVAPLQDLRGRVLLQAGVLELQQLQARLAGGRFSGTTRLDGNPKAALWTAQMRFESVDLDRWLRGLRAKRTGQPYLSGRLGGTLQAQGRGRSTAEILSTLDGRADLSLRDGQLSHLVTEAAGLDLAQGLAVLFRGDKPLALRCARLDLSVKDGVVQPRQAVIDNADSTMNIDGRIDLRDETLALRAVTKPKDFSPLTFRSPITVAGTLGNPRIGVETGRIVGKVLGALALGAAVGPAAALLPLADPGSRSGHTNPCAMPAGAPAGADKPAAAGPAGPAGTGKG